MQDIGLVYQLLVVGAGHRAGSVSVDRSLGVDAGHRASVSVIGSRCRT